MTRELRLVTKWEHAWQTITAKLFWNDGLQRWNDISTVEVGVLFLWNTPPQTPADKYDVIFYDWATAIGSWILYWDWNNEITLLNNNTALGGSSYVNFAPVLSKLEWFEDKLWKLDQSDSLERFSVDLLSIFSKIEIARKEIVKNIAKLPDDSISKESLQKINEVQAYVTNQNTKDSKKKAKVAVDKKLLKIMEESTDAWLNGLLTDEKLNDLLK
jgi:hypothetical protein